MPLRVELKATPQVLEEDTGPSKRLALKADTEPPKRLKKSEPWAAELRLKVVGNEAPVKRMINLLKDMKSQFEKAGDSEIFDEMECIFETNEKKYGSQTTEKKYVCDPSCPFKGIPGVCIACGKPFIDEYDKCFCRLHPAILGHNGFLHQ